MEKLSISGPVLIIVPHSDDEVLLFGGLIQRLISERKEVRVVLATNGDYEAACEQDGQIRPLETIAGLKTLHVEEDRVILMGYADTGMAYRDSFLAGLYDERVGDRVHRSRVGTHTYAPASHPEYHRAKYGEPAPYTRNAFRQDLREIIEEVHPQCIFTTHPLDAHGDHAALFRFVRETPFEGPVFSAFAHSKAGDIPLPEHLARIPCPMDLRESWHTAIGLDLTDEEIDGKRAALEVHVSALKPDAVDFLRSYIKRNEIYFPMEGYHNE